MTVLAVVGGDGDGNVGRADGAPRVHRDERLIAEPDDDGRRAELPGGLDAGAQRRDLPVGPLVVDDVDDRRVQRGGDLTSRHDDDGTDAGGQRRADGAVEDRASVEPGVELVDRSPEAGPGPGGEHHGDDVRPANTGGCVERVPERANEAARSVRRHDNKSGRHGDASTVGGARSRSPGDGV